MSQLLVVGAGGHGVVVADAAESTGEWGNIVFVDDQYPAVSSVELWQVIGKPEELPQNSSADEYAVVAIGNAEVRLAMCDLIAAKGYKLATVAHPRSVVSRLASVRGGSVLLANSVVNARADIGMGCIVNTGATVDHDCTLLKGAHIAPGAQLAADVTVGERSWIGIGASVREGVRIGRDAIVGAGAAVVKDVPDAAIVVGVPARRINRD